MVLLGNLIPPAQDPRFHALCCAPPTCRSFLGTAAPSATPASLAALGQQLRDWQAGWLAGCGLGEPASLLGGCRALPAVLPTA